MKLVLYNNQSEEINTNKTLIEIVELIGNLREASSLINPSILIELNPKNIKNTIVDDNKVYVMYNNIKIGWDSFTNKVLGANYCYIPDFRRYYFINDIISVRNDLWRINLSVDVAMSYKEEIKNLKAFVTRNEFLYDKYVKDDEISFYYDKEIIEYTPSKGDKVNTTFKVRKQVGEITTNYVISVINDQIWSTGDYVNAPDESLPQVDCEITGQGVTSANYCLTSLNVTRLARALVEDDTLYGYIISLIAFPFLIEYEGDSISLRLGKTTLDGLEGVNCYKMNPKLSQYYVIADFTITADDFKDYEPFTQYQIWIPYLSWVNINADDILNNRIIVYYNVNYQTGSAQVTIYDITNDKIIFTSNCQVGVKIGLSSTNAREVKDNENSNNIGLAVGLLTSALAVAGGAVSGNAVAVGGGLLTGGKTIANYIQNQNTNYNRASGNISSPLGGAYLTQDVKIRKTRLKPKNYNDEYFKLKGRPLNRTIQLRNLSGYTEVGDIHLENFGNATSQENDLIIYLLENGVIL